LRHKSFLYFTAWLRGFLSSQVSIAQFLISLVLLLYFYFVVSIQTKNITVSLIQNNNLCSIPLCFEYFFFADSVKIFHLRLILNIFFHFIQEKEKVKEIQKTFYELNKVSLYTLGRGKNTHILYRRSNYGEKFSNISFSILFGLIQKHQRKGRTYG
jgi:hypothetical protein